MKEVNMAFSMTGFGKGSNILSDRKCTVEIKSVNSKYCDMQIRLPRQLNGIENKIRKEISTALMRGKIDVYISYEDYSDESRQVTVDKALAKEYSKALSEVSRLIGTEEKVYASTVCRLGDVLKVQTGDIEDDRLWNFVEIALKEAIAGINEMRRTEGNSLVENINEKAIRLQAIYKKINDRSPFVTKEFAARLNKRIEELAGDLVEKKIEEQRLAMEVALFSDKCSIDEELIRLKSHLSQLTEILNSGGAIGKKLDFLIQEINRETNTIGSKANDLEITQNVVEMKTAIENIREQIQNLE